MQNVTLHAGWPARDYFAVHAASASFLKAMKRSPHHAQHGRLHPDDPTPAMKFGTAWHTAFFEPERFAAEYVAIPEGLDRRTKEGKALFAEVEASGRTPLSADEDELLAAMIATANAHPATQAIRAATRGQMAEPSLFADHLGVPVKIRPDLLVPPCPSFPSGLIVDGKTTQDASPDAFGRACWNMDYHIQAALYVDVVQAYYGTAMPPTFAWLAAEKDAPNCCAYYTAGENLIEHGRREYRDLLLVYGECERTGIWPGYSEEIAPLSLPAWVERAITANDDDGEDVAAIGYAA